MTQANMRKIQKEAICLADNVKEWLPDWIVEENNLCSPSYAIKTSIFLQTKEI